ncbi:leech-derived tryptase inhibitor C-like isoform X2 [Ostrinia furnacalis]|uniref:leech-derived tryptase inhibitor C-like isoform X2 n=1 Tax=Ostrinia furnacalis TaxID=93504 RepID=UPI0010397D84|nr:leech-derived tryptase inhibitor C-like isoform X2 [Ostrinia furnacalis]
MSYFILFLALMLLLCQSSAKVCDCPDYFRCACATNGLTYRNTCVMSCAGATYYHGGTCSDPNNYIDC